MICTIRIPTILVHRAATKGAAAVSSKSARMINIELSSASTFEKAARHYCAWATSLETEADREASALRLVSCLFAAGCDLGWEEPAPPDVVRPSPEQLDIPYKI